MAQSNSAMANSVSACSGWTDKCDFCEKRFGKWEEVKEDILAKVPTKPGIFEIALKNKKVTEVVDISIDTSDIRKTGYNRIDQAKSNVSDKKSKLTKSAILCRWMTFRDNQDKEVVNLCAHWFNNGVLPKFTSEWPGLNILKSADAVEFSMHLKKWCYPKKDPFWKESKESPIPLKEKVKRCMWSQPCKVCDAYFGEWRKMDEIEYKELKNSLEGIYMIATQNGEKIEPSKIYYDPKNISFKMKDSLIDTHKSLRHVYKNENCKQPKHIYLVRWYETSEDSNHNLCYLYAHWLNSEKFPYKMPIQRQVEENNRFVLGHDDKKWHYYVEILPNLRINKT